jgi:hypothetical protein
VTCEGRLDKEMLAGSCAYSEHIGWIRADVGSLSKVFGLVLNYEQRKEDSLYIQCVWPCWSFLEESVPFGSLSFQRWIIDPTTAYRHPSNRATCRTDPSIHQMPQKLSFRIPYDHTTN